jgi:hypothetical protein
MPKTKGKIPAPSSASHATESCFPHFDVAQIDIIVDHYYSDPFEPTLTSLKECATSLPPSVVSRLQTFLTPETAFPEHAFPGFPKIYWPPANTPLSMSELAKISFSFAHELCRINAFLGEISLKLTEFHAEQIRTTLAETKIAEDSKSSFLDLSGKMDELSRTQLELSQLLAESETASLPSLAPSPIKPTGKPKGPQRSRRPAQPSHYTAIDARKLVVRCTRTDDAFEPALHLREQLGLETSVSSYASPKGCMYYFVVFANPEDRLQALLATGSWCHGHHVSECFLKARKARRHRGRASKLPPPVPNLKPVAVARP